MKISLLRNFLAVLSIALVSLASAAPQPPSPTSLTPELAALNPTNILPADFAAAAKLTDRSGTAKAATLQHLEIPGATSAFRMETFARTSNASAVEAVVLTEQPLQKGDVCLARFSIRAPSAQQESGEAVYNCYFQQSGAPYEKHMTMQLGAGPDWRTYEIPFEAKFDSPAGTSALYFGFGLIPQSVEVASLQILNFQKRTTVDKLPATRFTYAGREAGAAWRVKALQRIEEIRTAPIKITVKDSKGQVVAGARVQAQLVQPAFAFGTAVSAALITSTSPESQIYRDKVVEFFDTVVIDNDLKWQQFLNLQRRENVFRCMDWFESKGLRFKGHNLIWPGWKFSPKRLQTLTDPTVELPQQIDTHIEDIVTATKGRVWAWDVLNEPVHERDFYTVFPETKSADWFKEARRLDPNALLFVNEYGMLNSRSSPDFIKRYLAFIQMLKDNGAPLDGIGVQSHVGSQVRNPVDVLADLDLLQTSGLPINITEFDINTKDEELQADYTRDFLIAIYSHPGVTGFIQWGFWQGAHWKPDAAMFRADWSEKPSAKAFRDLVVNQWRTHLDLQTDVAGQVEARGHLGIYEITVTKGDAVLKHRMTLTKDRGEVHLTMQAT